ncbi:hypothetical protein ZYGR_0H01900 [Zygosaccharomyces rouxii]|uniref:Endoplasmic reticulum junction formation protein lunapark n=2 Tax=Zygosaccharomyces rouxii TaxID=4956 RepID=C5DRH1_ZYGRC|nr:uncharacterized protein ZYRO0B08404g [Zygosaccharomyces rouxii]KAH9200080.1 hypothetical protein LQ764DRAFT_112174 [Zygosaccharomyces rouxii]GAV47349.1 hypothetical protein ZYGR_0H01900 [Zygosaccharomyces rouxii]CAR26382.1 ZYRO0B08404p [Zygosaccharomyces rouxii]
MMWLRGKRKTLVEKYTEELTDITSQIHQLDQKLKSSQEASDKLQSQLNYYGLATAALVLGYMHMIYHSVLPYSIASAIATLALAGLIKSLASKIDQWQRERQSRRLNRLRASHQQKLNKLKEETNFHATNSVIQRFSQGEDQTEDAMLLMDDEIVKKYQELKNLQEELNQFRKTGNSKDKQERDKWFDKVLNVLAGGDIPRPIVCTQCHKHSGAYTVGDGPLVYICPLCGWREPPLEEKRKEEDEVSSK